MTRRDAGAGTVVVVCLVAAVAAAGVGGADLAGAMLTRVRAAAAADAAALAAAASADLGPAGACRRARDVATRNGAVLARCSVAGHIAAVQVVRSPPAALRWAGVARLNARAGPAETYPEQPSRAGPPS